MRSITAIVVNWNAAQLTARAVDGLLAGSGGLPLEVLVVDNGSRDGSAAELEARYAEDERVRVLPLPENLGFGAGANAGMRAASGELLALLNNDAVPRPGWLAALAAALEAPDAARVGAVTSRILLAGRWRELAPAERAPSDRVLVDARGRRFADDPAGIERVNSTGNIVDVRGNGADRDWLAPADATASPEVFGFCGGAAMLRREALEETGLFDESLFMYYEDTDLSYRLREHGWDVRFVSDAVVEHAHAASSGTRSLRFLRWNARNRVIVAMRHRGALAGLAALARTAARLVRSLRPGAGDERRALVLALGDLAARAARPARRPRPPRLPGQ